MKEIASGRVGVTAPQAALNWIARKAGVSSILMGARTVEQLADNLAATTWSLTDAEINHLDGVSAAPLRYPYYMHRDFSAGRNPPLPLLPPVPGN